MRSASSWPACSSGFSAACGAAGKRPDLRHAQHALGEVGHGLAEALAQLSPRVSGATLVAMKQQRRGERFVIEAQLGQDARRVERVREQRLARSHAPLAVERRRRNRAPARAASRSAGARWPATRQATLAACVLRRGADEP